MWPEISHMMRQLVKLWDGAYSLEDMFDLLYSGQYQLWVDYNQDGKICLITTTRIVDYPRQRRLRITMAIGKAPQSWDDDYWPAIKQWAKAQGCEKIELTGRTGWARVLKGKNNLRTVITHDIE